MIGIDNIINNSRFSIEKGFENKLKNIDKNNDFDTILKQEIGKDNKKIDKKLMDACVEMESLFVSKMFKEMRNTIHKSEWMHGGFAEEIFEDMLYDEYALNLSKNTNLGLAKMLYTDLSKKR